MQETVALHLLITVECTVYVRILEKEGREKKRKKSIVRTEQI